MLPTVQVEPHEVPLPGYAHAPVEVQSVAPQTPLTLQAAEQQCVPVPAMPHMALLHWTSAEHVAPGPPLATHVPEAQ